MNIESAQAAIEQLFLGGAFAFDPTLETIEEQEYINLIDQIEPTNYEVAYQAYQNSPWTLNVIERGFVDRDDRNNVEQIRRERTYEHNGFRIFQLEILVVPSLLLDQNGEQEAPRRLLTTWWLNSQGHTVHYRQSYNGEVLVEVGILK